jgi:hypothetical protein
MVPPLDIMLKISDQLVWCHEHIGTFFSIKMPMIALPSLVVIAQNAFATHDVRKPVLEPVERPNRRLGKPPQYQFRKCRFRIDNTRANELNGFHVGNNNNILVCCQSLQQQKYAR